MTGQIDGILDGDNFSVQIYWDNDQTGVYNGKVLPSGRLDGEGWEKRSPNVRIPWHTEEGLNCKPPPAPPAPPKPPPPPPLRATGKTKTQPALPLQTPWIVAGPAIFPAPFAQTGIVILTWDAGPDHPEAEVWLKTPDGGATVAKQAKGGLQLTVQRGRNYEYMLMNGARIMAGVSFTAVGP